MKIVWLCRWEVIPGNGEHTVIFSTLSEAQLAMRRKISENIDLSDYLPKLEPQAAQFLKNYISDPQFPRSESDVPEDYEDYEDSEDYAEPEAGKLILEPYYIRWDHPCGACPQLKSNLVTFDEQQDRVYFDFWYEYPKKAPAKGVKGMSIYIRSHIDYGTSAYPLMVWKALWERPQTQEQIAKRISESWQTEIDRKAVGRHLHLLQDLGFPVKHNLNGYYRSGDFRKPSPDIKYTPNTYPILILLVLDETPKTQATIIKSIEDQFGATIDRKAVSRHIKLLQELHYGIHKNNEGYYLKYSKF